MRYRVYVYANNIKDNVMVNAAHMTKLEAVNDMLLSIGETPVQSLSSGLQDAAIAEAVLDKSNRQIQMKGWQANTRRNVILTKNASNQFALGLDTLKVDTVNPRYTRAQNTPSPSGYINVMMKRSVDDSKFLLYDIDNDTEVWTSETSLTVDIVQLLDFANLPPALQVYIMKDAGHRYQKGLVSSQVLFEFTREDVGQAMIDAIQEDLENDDTNMFRDNKSSHNIVYRYNPNYGG